MIVLEDTAAECLLYLYYVLFPECDIISRYFSLCNNGKHPVKIEKAMSLCLDLPSAENWQSLVLPGRFCYERMSLQRSTLMYGTQVFSSRRGTSSHQMNPFLGLCKKNTTEDKGEVYGFNFIYSGSY